MSNLFFPATVGLTWEVTPTPTFSTIVQKAKNRSEARICNDPYPLWTFDLNWEFVRDYAPTTVSTQGNYTDLQVIYGFYCARQGSFDNFLLRPSLVSGNAQDDHFSGQIGTGDGSTTAFQLVRNYGGFHDIIEAPLAGTVNVTVNGAHQTSATVSPTGLVTLASPPLQGAIVAASGQWAWRVRFGDDSISAKGFLYQLYELQSVKLQQVRDEQ